MDEQETVFLMSAQEFQHQGVETVNKTEYNVTDFVDMRVFRLQNIVGDIVAESKHGLRITWGINPPDPSMLSHPFHIHGHDFYVIEQGTLPNTYETPEAQAFVKRKLNEKRFNLKPFLPMKDTVSVPYQGYSVMRIIANNPGFWLLHCHYSFHQDTGMKVVIWVGDYEDIPPPPAGFPTCYNFLNEPLEIIENNIKFPFY